MSITFPPELLPSPEPGDEVEIIVQDAEQYGIMQELIERLKVATGPDPALNSDIRYVVDRIGFTLDFHNVPNFTGSFDAAKMLIPVGLFWHAAEGKTRPDEPLGAASIIAPVTLETIADAEHPSVVIALCIVALMARAALPTTHREGQSP